MLRRVVANHVFLRYIIPILLGGWVAFIVCIDPFIAHFYPVEIYGYNLLGLFPYILSSLIIALVLGIPFIFKNFWEGNKLLLAGTVISLQFASVRLLGPIDTLNIFTLLIFTFWLARVFVYKDRIIISPIFILHLGICAFAILSLSSSINPTGTIKGIITILIQVLLVFLLINYLTTKRLILILLNFFFLGVIFSSLIGISQYVIWATLGKVYVLPTGNPSAFWELTPFGFTFRAAGLFEHPNNLSTAVGPGGILMLYFSLSSIFTFRWRLLYFIGFILVATAVLLTFSRSSWLGMGLGCLLIVYFKKPVLLVYLLGTSIILAFTGILQAIFDMLTSFNPGAIDARSFLTKLSFQSIQENLWTGLGAHGFEEYPGNIEDLPVHNTILQSLTDIGIFAMIIFCLMFLLLFIRLFLGAINVKIEKDKVILQGILCFLVVFFTHMQFDMFFYFATTWMYVALIESVILVFDPRRNLLLSRSDNVRI